MCVACVSERGRRKKQSERQIKIRKCTSMRQKNVEKALEIQSCVLPYRRLSLNVCMTKIERERSLVDISEKADDFLYIYIKKKIKKNSTQQQNCVFFLMMKINS